MHTCFAVIYIPPFFVILISLLAIGLVFAIIVNVYKSKEVKKKLPKIQDVHTSTEQIMRLLQSYKRKDLKNGKRTEENKKHIKP